MDVHIASFLRPKSNIDRHGEKRCVTKTDSLVLLAVRRMWDRINRFSGGAFGVGCVDGA